MYVRWKSYPLTDPRHAGRQLLAAVLVKSVRIDGKPRQRTVAYLGAIHDTLILLPSQPWHRKFFWRDVCERLDRLDLDPDLRARIVVQLARRVPEPAAQDDAVLAQAIARVGM